MSNSYDDLLTKALADVRCLSVEELSRELEEGGEITLLDVREREETREGYLPGALLIPRGFLEIQVEQRIPNREATIVVYCAKGVRSVFAAQTLQAMGYRHVRSLYSGISGWKERGYSIEVPPSLSEAQRERYKRHLLLPEVGEAGQARLLKAKVLLLGAGGLGSPAALYLAAAGVGTLGLVDADRVEVSNLQRQILHTADRVGEWKVESAEKALRSLNPEVRVNKIQERLTSENVDRIFDGYDLIVDGCDNFPTRYLVNDASLFHRKPVIHGSIFRFEGQVTTFIPWKGPCYRCMYPEPPPPHLTASCAEAGVLGVLPGVIGVLQATEVVKWLLGRGELLEGRLLLYDSLQMKFREMRVQRNPNCSGCGSTPTVRGYIDYDGFCGM